MDFISFDLETTGTLSHADHIVEIGAVKFRGGKPGETFSELISCPIPMPEGATNVNGITDEMLKGKPHLEEVLKKFTDFCEEDLLVAHNAPFDFQFLLRAFQEKGVIAPRGSVLDTCQLARRSFKGMANYKLSTLCDYFKIASGNFHRAEADANYCGKLFIEILKHKGFNTYQIRELCEETGVKTLRFPDLKHTLQMELF